MEAWKNKTWAWDIEGISLHFYTVVKWPPAFKATGFGENEYAWMITIRPKWKERLLEMLVFQARMAMPNAWERDPLLLHLIAERFERSEHAGLDIQAWLKANHVPFERS